MDDEDGVQSLQRHDAGSEESPTTGYARHTFGLFLLSIVVVLWTASNFLASSILADNTFAKPFFVMYFNTSAFMLTLMPTILRKGYQKLREGTLRSTIASFFVRRRSSKAAFEGTPGTETQTFLDYPEEGQMSPKLLSRESDQGQVHLGFRSTARLAMTFCLLWFTANYFAAACLQHTNVASATILTSTSSIWTLLIGACTHTEKFTWRKLLGVFASIVGITLISRSDLTTPGQPSSSPPTTTTTKPLNPFPDKAGRELALGDILALTSAIIYGLYTITLKRTTVAAHPLKLNMLLFFGLVGFFNFIFLWPLFPILHFTGLEPFQLPPTHRVWTIIALNCVTSLMSDICWAYAMVFTSPLVVTVGLTLTIPLSLVGEMVLQGSSKGLLYWFGAAVVVASFVFVDREEIREEETTVVSTDVAPRTLDPI